MCDLSGKKMRTQIIFVALIGTFAKFASAQQPLYGQCGGIGFTGSTTCVAGAVCVYTNAYYSQCLPGSATTTTTTTTAAKTSTTTKTTTTTITTTSGSTSTTLPSTFKWKDSGIQVKAQFGIAVKDPSVVFYNGLYHMFYTTVSSTGGYNMGYISFADWSKASSATQKTLSTSAIGSGYKTAPQIFYHTPSKLWYLVYQNGNAGYSTNSDITNVNGWSATKNFYSSVPSIVTQNIGSGNWLDFWVICDTSKCYLFSSDDNGHLYRSETSLTSFPNGFSQPVIALSDSNKFNLFEASNMYHVKGTGKYLLIVEAIVSIGRYFRSWSAPAIAGPYTALAATQSNPFAGKNNFAFSGTAWTNHISSGGLIPDTYDETQTISACGMRLAFQGLDPSSDGLSYNLQPWVVGLATQVC
ncbi:hypothetical protein HK096_008632 [Nowakowskiella sp. JEL0078]|nr:hypothetical protein HK096_008632 [Nowakowskiella sp. JEL0078]